MGTEVEITTDASEVAVAAALEIVASLDRRWSCVRPGSELSRLNRAHGPVVARPSTARAIGLALAGTRLTRGWFDPTRSVHAAVPARDGAVAFDARTGLVDIPDGIELDLGGIAKGLAADIAAALLREGRATQAGVSIGGDVRIRSDTRVLVEVAAPGGRPGAPALIGLRDGGIAVSGSTPRRDPITGRPAATGRAATVVATTAAGAEMLATAAAIAPIAEVVDFIEAQGATAWLVEADGSMTTVGEPDRFLVAAGWLDDRSSR